VIWTLLGRTKGGVSGDGEGGGWRKKKGNALGNRSWFVFSPRDDDEEN